jgi:ketosteroid isomerase-like protein
MLMTTIDAGRARILDVLECYDTAVAKCDAAAAASLYADYGACYSRHGGKVFGTDIEEYYRQLFAAGHPASRHDLCELATEGELVYAITTSPPQPGHTETRELFVMTLASDNWQILAHATP